MLDLDRILSFDMGGTTAKICLLDDYEPQRAASLEVARVHRFKKGSGLPLLLPVIKLLEIGAGGGSIAHLDALGLLKVGPESAGAAPGPACYGSGGTLPTVTDAALTLGYLDPNYFLGGRMQLDVQAARDAILRGAAQPLGVDVLRAAAGIYEVATQNMADAARVHLAELGKDARDYTLIAFGGAGPVHACRLARSLKIRRVIIPPGAGATSAVGFLTAPMAFEWGRTYLSELGRLDVLELEAIFAEMLKTSLEVLRDAGIVPNASTHTRWADMRYWAQTHEIEVELPNALDSDSTDIIRKRFEERYYALYGNVLPGRDVEITRCRLRAEGPRPPLLVPNGTLRGGPKQQSPTTRDAYFAGLGGAMRCHVYRRETLQSGDTIDGPAVVQEENSTALLDPGTRATVDAYLNLQVELVH
jgi:N-methylhydantoinase A/oxoprolinase/acetone carboxylase beta subunit